jgi:hypothetical protein
VKTKNPRNLIQTLIATIEQAQRAGRAFQEPNFDPGIYAQDFSGALEELKQISAQVMLSGEMNGFVRIAEIPVMFKELASDERPSEANEIFWDQLSKAYPIKDDWFFRRERLSDPLELRIFTQMVAQSDAPEKVISRELDRLPSHLQMEAMTTALRLITSPDRVFELINFDFLLTLQRSVAKHKLTKIAAEHIAEHKDLYFPFFKRVLQVSLLPETLKAEGIVDPVAIMRRELHAFGYSTQVAERIINDKSDDKAKGIPSPFVYSRIKKAISLPADLLAELHKLTGHPLILEIAELAMDHPKGLTPYAFLEQIGVVRSPAWYIAAQEKTPIGSAIKLYEHAIMTPGIELSTQRVKHQPMGKSEPGLFEALINLVERVPVNDPECRRKGQEFFDALVFNATFNKVDPGLMDLLLASRINHQFFRSHPALKGQRLEEALGL